MIYLDWAATAKPNKHLILEAIDESFKYFANPSAIYEEGILAKKRLEEARANIASFLMAKSDEIFFTSSATESTQIIITSFINHPFKNEILISDREHKASKEMAHAMKMLGYKINIISSTKKGFITPDAVLAKLNEKTALISLLLVDNETGALQPIKEIGNALLEEKKKSGLEVHFHVDGVQAIGKIPVNFSEMPIDSSSLSSHKIGAMRGAGILYLKKKITPFLLGGGQEKGIRSGTENLASILCFEKCLKDSIFHMEERLEHVKKLNAFLIEELKAIEGVETIPFDRNSSFENNDLEKFSPYIVSFCNHYLRGEVLVRMMSDKGIAISSGSACSSKNKKPFKLAPTKYSENVARVSIGYETTKEEIKEFIKTLKEIIGALIWK